MITGLCHICGKPTGSSCRLCGRTTCERHLDARGSCTLCIAGKH